jgi:protein phosphatase
MNQRTLHDLVFAVIKSGLSLCNTLNMLISEGEVTCLCASVSDVFAGEGLVLHISRQIYIVGDIHGNFNDLLRIFERCGYPPLSRYLFLGDYIDRGEHAIEVLILLFALKCKFPDHIFLLRGNHETRSVGSGYGFTAECRWKYSLRLNTKFHQVFQLLPIAAVVHRHTFCVHGGISPLLHSLGDFQRLAKPGEYLTPVFTDLLWSDPSPTAMHFAMSKRGIGHAFGEQAVQSFLNSNNLAVLIRSHELCSDGVARPFENCVTVFSTTDYCGLGNNAAVLAISDDGQITDIIFAPLTHLEKQSRRILFPEWTIEEKCLVMESTSPIFHDFDPGTLDIPI